MTAPASKHRLFRALRWLVYVGAVITLVAIAGVPVYVHPKTDALRSADAIYVLGGHGPYRYDLAAQLAFGGYSKNLVYSNPDPGDWITETCRTPHPPVSFWCVVPDPKTTEGEALAFNRLAAEHHWKSVIVITERPHISRSRFIFDRCFSGDVVMVASADRPTIEKWIYQYVYQSAGYLKFVLTNGCG